ncbi:centrosomal protein of 164 kDa-like isoform X3 [Mizuhopecten yessoensis]|uniref:centrosomal protein of 164 kDa-like isoform X3 n=1 Tax=Mizuhopecten yessoensis TaxID=6573 RepID=UPI000B45EC55|nr:centrosomal protein of 164 kDa-like isoform X3 [Mizuhopecten yessoensis]
MDAGRMMINDQVILEEDYDENYQPGEDEIVEYSQIIGIDPRTEPHLLWIAREGINAPLPEHWRPCQDPNDDIYYFNFASGESIWDHPCDEFYRKMVAEERKKYIMGGGSRSGPGGQGPGSAGGKKGKLGKDDGKKKKDKQNKQSPLKQLGPLKAEQSLGTPSLHRGGPGPGSGLEPMKSGGSLGPLRGSTGTSQPMRSSMNTTTGSFRSGQAVNLSKSGNLTSSMSIPIYSVEFEDEEGDHERPVRHSVELEIHDVAGLGYEDSDSDKVGHKESDSDSEDYGKDIDFGIDNNLSERIMNLGTENLDPVRGSLEKLQDFDPTMSALSTARGDSPGGNVSPLDRPTADDRKKRAEVAALAAERRLTRQDSAEMPTRAEQDRFLRDEESKINLSNDRTLQDLKQRLKKELENAKLDLLEDKDRKLRKLKEEIALDQDTEETRLKHEKEQQFNELETQIKSDLEKEKNSLDEEKAATLERLLEEMKEHHAQEEETLRKQMDGDLEKLREEVRSLQKEEQSRLVEDKHKILERLKSQVDSETLEEQRRLEEQKREQFEALQAKQRLELESMTEEAERKHRDKVDQVKRESSGRHEKELQRIREELKHVHEQEREEKEQELEAAKQRQKAIDDLDRGLDEVMSERRQDIQQQQQKELSRLRDEHDNAIRKLREEFQDKERKERQLLDEKIESEVRKLQKQSERDLEEARRKFERKRESMAEQLEDEHKQQLKEQKHKLRRQTSSLDREEEEYQEKIAEFERKKTNLEKSAKNLDTQEKKLEERRKKFREDKDNFELDQDEAFSSKNNQLSTRELERLKEERKQIQEEITTENDTLEQLKTERRTIESDITKMKMTRENNTRKLNDMKERMERKGKDLDSLQQRIIDAADETKSLAEERLRASSAARSHGTPDIKATPTRRTPMAGLLSDDEIISDIPPKRRGKKIRYLDDRTDEEDVSSFGGRVWQDLLSDDDSLDEFPIARHVPHRSGELKEHFSKEKSAINTTKEFLRKHRQSLKRRQSALQAARQELTKDIVKQRQGNLSPDSAFVLADVKQSLEKEELELDQIESQMRTGSRLVREKERRLRQLKSQVHTGAGLHQSESDSDLDYSPFEHNYRPAGMPNLDLSEDEGSSGISSNDNSLDNVIRALTKQNNQHQSLGPLTVKVKQDGDPIAASLLKINTELAHIITKIGTNSAPGTPMLGTQGSGEGKAYSIPLYTPPLQSTGVYSSAIVPHSQPIQAWAPPNPYINSPSHHVDYASLVVSAEQSLERKWRKYFGDRRPPLTSASLPPGGAPVAFGHNSVRDQLRQYRMTLQDNLTTNPASSQSTQDKLSEQKRWLQKFGQDISFGASFVKAPGSDAGSVRSVGAGSISSLKMADPTISSTPQRSVPSGTARLELDEYDEIRVRHLNFNT